MNRVRSPLEFPLLKGVQYLLFLLCSAMGFGSPSLLFANEQTASPAAVSISFAERLHYYLSDQTRDVVSDLLAREKQLLQLVQNVHKEIAERGVEPMTADPYGFRDVYSRRDTLVQSYQSELVRLIEVYDDLQRMQRVASYRDDERMLEQVNQTKDDLVRSLEDRELYKKGIYSSHHVGGMLDDYSFEMDSLLNIYDALAHSRVAAQAQNNQQALAMIEQQQAQLFKVLGAWNQVGPLADTSLARLRYEAESVSRVMKQVDSLQAEGNLSEAEHLEAIKSGLFQRVDKMVIDLLAQAGYSLNAYPTVSDFVEAWKKERLLDIQTALTEYRILQQRLLETATLEQRNRMLARELQNVAENYSEGQYRLTEYQIESVQSVYRPYYSYFVPLTFYLAECRYHRKAYDSARDLYQALAVDSSATPYRPAALLRLLQYANTFQLQRDFYIHYERLQREKMATPHQLALAHYLAANRFFSDQDVTSSRNAIAAIPTASAYYMPAQFLLAIVYLNQNDFVKALPILHSLADETNYPWTDLQTAYLRNAALLKLGMIHYQRGEFKLAISFFDRVSQGFENHDQALIGQAWSALRMGDYHGSLAQSDRLLKTYLASQFTYEALTLAGHCRRLLDQPGSALDAYRHVVQSRNEKVAKKEYDQERDRVMDQHRELNRLEREALEKKQAALYAEIERIKGQITGWMDQASEKTDSGNRLLRDYYDERVEIFDRMDDLQTVIEVAEREERPDLADKARKQLSRLITVLETYRSDEGVTNPAFLIEYPLAAKEAGEEHQRARLDEVYRELESEKRRLEGSIARLSEYQRLGRSAGDQSDRSDLEILQTDLEHLRDRMSALRKSVLDARPQLVSSNAELWNDFSGFGLTDIIYQERGNRLNQIDDYANQLKGIETVLADRRGEIEGRLQRFENEIRRLQDSLLSRKIQLEQMERRTYFNKMYFDDKEQEEEGWEEQLRRQQQP